MLRSNRAGRALAIAAFALTLAACGSSPRRAEAPRPVAKPAVAPGTAPRDADTPKTGKPGGYYLDDGPLAIDHALLDRVPDAVPRAEPIKASTTRPYTALGRTYTPMSALTAYKATGVASWYGKRYHGQPTASGEVYDMFAMTAAHPTLPIPSYVRVTQVDSGRSVVVRVNDRGPFHADRLIDLSYTAAYRLGLLSRGQGTVRVETMLPPFDPQPVAAAGNPGRPPDRAPAPPGPNVAVPPLTTAESTTEATRGAYLQLGAFSQRENAQAFLARIGAELEWLAPRTSLRKDGALIRVQAGPFDSDQEASQAAARVKAVMDFQPMIVR